MDNPFNIPLSGSADWDTDLSAAFQAVERGYHVTERAGQAISSGQVLTLNSGGFFFPYAPGSASIVPHAYAYTAASSGDSITALAWGIVRSLDINSLGVPGKLAFSTASGFLSTATLGVPLGSFLKGEGVLFNPSKSNPATAGATALAALTDVDTTGVSNGQVLSWSDASSKWKPAAAGGASPFWATAPTPPVSGSFTLIASNATATTSNVSRGVQFNVTGAGAVDRNAILDVAIPNATWTMTALLVPNFTNRRFMSVGLYTRDATSAKIRAWCAGTDTTAQNPVLRQMSWTNINSFSAATDLALDMGGGPFWLQAVMGATNVVVSFSRDGESYETLLTESRSLFANTPDHCGVFFGVNQSEGPGSGVVERLLLMSFACTST